MSVSNLERLNVLLEDLIGDTGTPDTVLKEMGLDSLDHTELKLMVEEEFDVDVPEDTQWNTVQDILNTIKEQQ